MANYGLIGGLAQGMSRGIQDAGNILGIMRQKRADEREEELFPIRKEQLEVSRDTAKIQGEVADIGLEKLQAEQKLLSSSWNIDEDEYFKGVSEEDKAPFKRILANHPNPKTLAAKFDLQRIGKTDLELLLQNTKLKVAKIKEAEADLATRYGAAMKSKNPVQIKAVTDEIQEFLKVKKVAEGDMNAPLVDVTRETSYKAAAGQIKNNSHALAALTASYERAKGGDETQFKTMLLELQKQSLYVPKTALEMISYGLQIGGEEGKVWGKKGADLLKDERASKAKVTWGPRQQGKDGIWFQVSSTGEIREHKPDKTEAVADKQIKEKRIQAIRDAFNVDVKDIFNQIELAETEPERNMWRQTLNAKKSRMKYDIDQVLKGDTPQPPAKKKTGRGAGVTVTPSGNIKLYQNYLQ